MRMRVATGILAPLTVLGLMSVPHALAPDDSLGIAFDLQTKTLTWADYDGEVAYKASGSVEYLLPLPCDSGHLERILDTVEFSEHLPANTISFRLPPPTDERAQSVKGMAFLLEAIGADGEVLASGATAFIADGPICPEVISPAGSGPGQASSGSALLAIAALLALGAVSLFCGLATWRKRAA